MKLLLTIALALALSAPALALSAPALAQNTQGMNGMNRSAGASSMTMAEGIGVVKAVDRAAGAVTIEHEPIAALGWPAMTMTFKANRADMLNGVRTGEKVKFQLMKMGGAVQLTAVGPN